MLKIADLEKVVQRVHRAFVDALDLFSVGDLSGEELRRKLWNNVERALDKVSCQEKIPIEAVEREMIIQMVLDEAIGLGPLELLLKDPRVNAILVKGPREVYVRRDGREEMTNVTFRDEGHLTQIIERIASQADHQVNVAFPLLQSHEDCLVIRCSPADSRHLEVSLVQWSPESPAIELH